MQQQHFRYRKNEKSLPNYAYGEELKAQMHFQKQRKLWERYSQIAAERYILHQGHDPYGKSGSGAPLRDQYGYIITSRQPFLRRDHIKREELID